MTQDAERRVQREQAEAAEAAAAALAPKAAEAAAAAVEPVITEAGRQQLPSGEIVITEKVFCFAALTLPSHARVSRVAIAVKR